MQTTTILALFCTIVVLFIGANDGAPTTTTTTTVKTLLIKTQAPVFLPQSTVRYGGRTAWKTKIDPKSKKLFNDYKKVISKKLQTVHKVPAKFNPKPTKTASQVVSGFLYHYLVKLPTNKFAYVTILDKSWKKADYGKEEHVTVRPDLYALNDKNI